MDAYLYLKNGHVFKGKAFGHLEETTGEVVLNTSMIGYQEILTDPACFGQILTMTYPLIGNYGVNLEDSESDGIKVKGLVVKDRSIMPNNFRCEMELDSFLDQNKIPAIEGIDTRALTKILRDEGTMSGIISFKQLTKSQIKERIANFSYKDAVKQVSVQEKVEIPGEREHIAVIDLGIKKSLLEAFRKRGFQITLLPHDTKPDEWLLDKYDAIFLSGGPGDPMHLTDVIRGIKEVLGKKPIMGVGLGHQLIAIALGGRIKKLKLGHRGSAHAIRDIKRNRLMMTSQNNSYALDEKPDGAEVTFVSLNDNTIQGIKHEDYSIYSVQFQPGAGPQDTEYVFDELIQCIESGKEGKNA
ncbi:MAG: carbamoyl phosphate synthase small subunit [Peptostreptococcales bacterium]